MGTMFITALFHREPQSAAPQSQCVLVSQSQLQGKLPLRYNYTVTLLIKHLTERSHILQLIPIKFVKIPAP